MIVALSVAALLVVLAALRLLNIDGNKYTACALALMPYGVVGGGLVGGLALALAPWWAGGIVLAVTAVLTVGLLPRMIPSANSRTEGPRLRVMASNLYFGRGDVKAVVELVRTHQVDVLNLLELTAESAEEFLRAGLFDLLPYRLLRPADGGGGSGVVSRYPLTELALVGPSRLAQPSIRLDLRGTEVDVVAVHPVPPTVSTPAWKTELAGLPRPVADSPIRILAGDFNATADHAAFRRLLRAGYLDAAQQRGAGLAATWRLGGLPPVVTLDHVLVDSRAGVTSFRTFDIPGSDHKAVYAELLVPESGSTA